MGASVHPSAIVDPEARLAEGVHVGPNCVIDAGVSVGRDSRLLPGTILMSGTSVGAACLLGPYASIGGEPMDSAFRGEQSHVELGDGVQVRDFASIHRATGQGQTTRVLAGALVMSYVHVSHNAQIGQHATLTSGSQLAGHTEIGAHAVLGAGTHVHQFVRVGMLSMTGAMSGLNRDVLPYSLAVGKFAEHYGVNRVGVRRAGITGERYSSLEKAMRALRRREPGLLEELAESSEEVRILLEFIAAGTRGLSRFRGGGP